MKKCSCCKQEKSFDFFYKRSKSSPYYKSWCIECSKKLNMIYRNKNKIRIKKVKALSYQKCKDKNFQSRVERHYKQTYGISHTFFLDICKSQQNCCKICKQTLTFNKVCFSRAVLDHCHTTGKIRGVLCNRCNVSLGNFKDSQVILESAISYLREYHENPAA